MTNHRSNEITNIKLELLRSGPAHNQLLSPLTNYIALCGADGPVTIQLPFEHRQLLMRLKRLTYPLDKNPATDEQRQSEVRDMGETVGRVFGQVPALLSELGTASTENGKLIHLRLVLSAFELGMIPFEAAVAPDGFPGSGSPLFLQMRTPVSITREIRRGRPLHFTWPRKPRILFAFAAPDGLYVPWEAHLQALRNAIEPWVKIADKDKPGARIELVKEILTVLPNASLEKIRKLCETTEFTHIHLLAHGKTFMQAGDEHHGVLLLSELDPEGDTVDGERLAIALTSHDDMGTVKNRPTIVTLATCDSGNIESVLTPGGSIAHELNAAGIPWVIASQFPLWMKASAIAAEVLYSCLLKGDDPRWVLYQLRHRLRMDCPGTHDWTSIVAYATVSADFEQQVNEFRDQQTRSKTEVKFARIDELAGFISNNAMTGKKLDTLKQVEELKSLCVSTREILRKWREEALVAESPKLLSERLGMSGASEKRLGIAYSLISEASEEAKESEESKRAYNASRDFYHKAIEAGALSHWVLTQYLSISALPILGEFNDIEEYKKKYSRFWITAREIAESQLSHPKQDRLWALCSLTEITLLGSIYEGRDFDPESAKEKIRDYCKEIRGLIGPNDDFPLLSTRRQFSRYRNIADWKRPEWDELAEEALMAL